MDVRPDNRPLADWPLADWPLAHTPVLFLDCQSTGASPSHGALLELGWAVATAAAPRVEPSACLVELPEGARIPRAVSRITGLSMQDLDAAIPPREAWSRLRRAVDERWGAPPSNAGLVPTVIHFAQFERPFLEELQRVHDAALGFPFDIVCTHAIAKRVFPDLPRRSIRAIAGYFGFPVEQLRRSAGHVAATVFVWHHLVRLLDAERGIHGRAELAEWLSTPSPRSRRRVYPMDRAARLAVPDGPGVYRLRRENLDVLYVGKAKHLRRRVNSYFQKQQHIPERTLELLSQVRSIDVSETPSEVEAALLEADEIKRHRPPYNVALLEGERALWFFSTDLRAWSREPDAAHVIGPIASRRPMASLLALAASVEGRPDPDGRARASSLGLTGGPRPDDATYAEGLERLRAELIDYERSPRGLLRFGTELWRRNLVTFGRGRARPDDEPHEPSEPAWSPEAVVECFHTVALDAAHASRRARWLVSLSESTVAWREPGAPEHGHHLVLDGGRVVSRGDWREGVSLPTPSGWTRARPERRARFDVESYDRLRVLTTELRRLATSAPDPPDIRVQLDPSRHLDPRALGRLLRWI